MIKIRAFRAVEDPAASFKFIEGHKRVLKSVGVTEVTSSNHDWAYNPSAYVIIVESEDGSKVYGGARIHATGGTQPLPIEDATGEMDPKIYDLVRQYSFGGTGELCGLWNSREVAGLGIGSIFLTRSAVTIATQIGLQTLFALCAPYTVKMAETFGYKIETSIGNNGTFYYPKLDLLATAMFLNNTNTLETADPFERERIFDLRNNPVQTTLEKPRNAELIIDYNLLINECIKNNSPIL